jgi:hypothetical protein
MATTPTGRQAQEAADRLTEWLRRSNGSNAIADYMDKEAIVTILEHNEALRAALGRHDGCSRMSNADRLLLTVREEPPPFGAVRFDGAREFDGQTNQDRAALGKQLVALSYLLSANEEGAERVAAWADTINLDEVPELPLTEALLAVQHYAHRDHISLYGTDGAWALAQKQFNEQSGGAAL